MLLCVRGAVRKFVFNCEFVWTEPVLMPLVACRLSLVACRLSQKLWRRASACQVLLQNFLHFFCENDCNCGQCVHLSLVYSIARFFISFNFFGKVFFNLTAKMLRAQRSFDDVLMTYSFIYPWRTLSVSSTLCGPCGLL